MLEIRHLRTLHALREEGSLAAAAEHLHLTPSALSHQLKELEQWLSLSLLSRKTKPLQFSAAGQRLLQLADQVLPLVHNARGELVRLAHGQTGRLLLAPPRHAIRARASAIAVRGSSPPRTRATPPGSTHQGRKDWPGLRGDRRS